MAHHKATKKAIRQTKKRTARSVARKSRVRTHVKKVEAAIASKDKKGAQAALKDAQKELLRAVSKGVMKLNTASRKISRLNAKVKAIAIK